MHNSQDTLRRLSILTIFTLIGLVVSFGLMSSGCDKKAPTTYESSSYPVIVIPPTDDSTPLNQDSVLVIQISSVGDAIIGLHHEVDVTVDHMPFRFDGFDFLLGYYQSRMSFQGASPGVLHTDCGWEYFTYRIDTRHLCDTCPTGMMMVVGIAETNNGAIHPDWDCVDSLGVGGPYTLFTLDFLLYKDCLVECSWNPVRFFWTDCSDNLFSCFPDSSTGNLKLGASRYVFDDTTLTKFLNNDSTGYPTFTGFQTECPPIHDPSGIQFAQAVDYINGGIRAICPEPIDARGDLNLNGVKHEIVDAVIFSNYFVQGASVFNVNYDGQVAASDVNKDGVPLEVADLVYLIRIVVGDALPYPNLTPVYGSLTHSGGVLSIDTRAGAAYIVAEGNVNPTLLANRMELNYAFDGTNTRILISNIEKGAYFEGDFLQLDAQIISVECATYDGKPITFDSSPVTEITNHPNPFRDTTVITYTAPTNLPSECSIFNATGTRVAKFTYNSVDGAVWIEWDASDQPEGIYVCRVEVEGRVETHTMMLVRD